MKRAVGIALLAFFSTGLWAYGLKSSELESLCLSKSESERAMCALVMRGFVDGFIEGTAQGVMGAYRYDTQVHALVKDINARDFGPRLNRTIDMSMCGQRVSAGMMTETFLAYLRSNPKLRAEDYSVAMYLAVIRNY